MDALAQSRRKMKQQQAPMLAALVLLLTVGLASAAHHIPSGPSTPTDAILSVGGPDAAAAGRGARPSSAITAAAVPLVAQPLVAVAAGVTSKAAIPADIPAGTPFSGEFIVLYKPGTDVEAASADSHARATAATAAAVESGALPAARGASPAGMVTILSAGAAGEGVPGQAVVKVPAALDAADVRAALRASADVLAVVPNRVVRIAQAAGACYAPHYAAAVQAVPVAGVSWPGCTGTGISYAAFGERCGPAMDQFRWLGLYAYRAGGTLVRNCIAYASGERNATRLAENFGSCGVAPTKFSGLPTSVCTEQTTSACVEAQTLSRYAVRLSRPLCSNVASSSAATFVGEACGPNNALVRWTQMSSGACASLARASLDQKQQADWLGQCGVPPSQVLGLPTRVCGRTPAGGASPLPGGDPGAPAPAPAPAKPGGVLPRVPLAPGEGATNWGMARVGAYDAAANTVASIPADASGYRVVVIDTGADAGHPDLNVVEVQDFVEASGSATYKVDGHGHGTHVAGIIGAKNTGSGMFGVAPGAPIIAFKVLGADGSGSLDAVYQAYATVLARLQAGTKIAAINLSLGSPVTDEESTKAECDWVQKIAAFGATVVAAAGNDGGAYLGDTLPTACADAVSVTSLASNDAPSSFSNLARTSSPASVKAKTIAAPGSSILSTWPGNRYQTLSGTSMATPFVTGGVLRCVLARQCSLNAGGTGASSVATNAPVLMAAAKAPGCAAGAARCGPQWGATGDAYYGYALNVRPW